MYYQLACKSGDPLHQDAIRARQKVGNGTSNFLNSAKKCDQRRGVTASTRTLADLPYSKAAHRAIIALRCAKSQRPANMVKDKFYEMEVQMLRPGTEIPHPSTISRDIKDLYKDLAVDVRNYFLVSSRTNTCYEEDPWNDNITQARNDSIHLAVDGWTAPIVASYLGIVIIWVDKGTLYRAILEFARFGTSSLLVQVY
jgi:hypothetical protein